MKADERVLCLPESHFRAVGFFTGFQHADEAYRTALLNPIVFSYQPRSQCETDPTFKQLIPYVVLTCGNHVFHYRRGGSSTETRLRAKRSFGIGGHINDDDAGAPDPFRAGMFRELQEEVEIRSTSTEHFLGFIYDPSTPVGEVHLGVVYLYELDNLEVFPRETGIADAGFASLAELLATRHEFETWSQLVLPAL